MTAPAVVHTSRHVASIAGRLSLRSPQRRSLELLDRLTAVVPPDKHTDVAAALAAVRAEFPSVQDFEREFASVCFALATGVGKTRLMGAFITYLHLAHGLDHFFVLAPNLTIYDKLIADFTPNTPKYVFRGIPEFAVQPPEVITGDNYESRAGSLFSLVGCKINIFNISKINSEVRGGKAAKIKRLSEYLGQSYFEYLAERKDLVLLMDESHRYRAAAGMRAINELKPVLGLELTATPFVETARGPVPFRNVVYDYPLGRAMEDGFVKEPAVVTRKNFSAAGMAPAALDELKLKDGVRLHEATKVELETYARSQGVPIVKPFLLVIARDTTHAAELVRLVESDDFFGGRYRGRALQVDSSRTGAEEEAMVARLLNVERADEPTEIVVHVNMLKEGWDVTNLYTIVPLRAANARILIEQSIGRGLRLPYGRRTGVDAVDRLNIVAHDRFQEIVDEARRPDSPIRMRSVVLDGDELERATTTVESRPNVLARLGIDGDAPSPNAEPAGAGTGPDGAAEPHAAPRSTAPPAFTDPQEREVARIAYEVITRLSADPARVPTSAALQAPEVQAEIVRAVEARYAAAAPAQTEMGGVLAPPDVGAVVARTAEIVAGQTIDIPRILVIPRGEGRSGYRPFALALGGLRLAPPSDELWIQHLRTGRVDRFALDAGGAEERRPEDYVVAGLVDFYDDVSYDDHADLLYDLAGQVVAHLRSYLDEGDVRKVLRYHQREIARLVHAQMQPHYERAPAGYEVRVSRGVTELKPSAYTRAVHEPVAEYRVAPADRSNMARYLFGGFSRCLYPYQKFESDAERKLAVILERESEKWFRPARGQFQIFYELDGAHREYQPDFVAETKHEVLMLEPKMRKELDSREVLVKKVAATLWCERATEHATAHGAKPWRYALIPHDAIADNITLDRLVRQFGAL